MASLRKNESCGHEDLLAPRDITGEGSDGLFDIFSNVANLLQVFEVIFLISFKLESI